MNCIYVSALCSGDIAPAGDQHSVGTIDAPAPTLERAEVLLRDGDSIKLKGDPERPAVYRHQSSLTLRGASLACTSAYGAVVQSALEKGCVVSVEPGATGLVRIGAVVIDGRECNLAGIDVARALTGPFSVILDKPKIVDCQFHGVWTQNYPSAARIEIRDAEFSLHAARSCIQHRMADGAALDVTGGTYRVTNQNYSGCGFISAYGAGDGCSIAVRDVQVDITTDPDHVGEATGAINIYNISGAVISGGSYRVDASVAPKNAQVIIIQPTRDEFVRACGDFLISDIDIDIINIPGRGAGAGIWIGHDGTKDEDVSNGKINGGSIRRVNIKGTIQGQIAGLLGIAVASHADTQVSECTVDTASIGFVCKESSPHLDRVVAKDCMSSHILLKAARPGTLVERSRTLSTCGELTIHLYGHNNSLTGNDCAGCVVRDNHFVNDGGTKTIFVQIDPGQDVKLSGNNYFNRSGTLDEFPWRFNGVYYATLEEWRNAVEPDATSYDPDAAT